MSCWASASRSPAEREKRDDSRRNATDPGICLRVSEGAQEESSECYAGSERRDALLFNVTQHAENDEKDGIEQDHHVDELHILRGYPAMRRLKIKQPLGCLIPAADATSYRG